MPERRHRRIPLSEEHKRLLIRRSPRHGVEAVPWPMEQITQSFPVTTDSDVLFGPSATIELGTGPDHKHVTLYPELGSVRIHQPASDETHEYGNVNIIVADGGLLFVSRLSKTKAYVSPESLLLAGSVRTLATDEGAEIAAASPGSISLSEAAAPEAQPFPQLRPSERARSKEQEELIVGTIAGSIKTREQQSAQGPEVVQAHFPFMEEGLQQSIMVITKRAQAKSVKKRADQGYLAQGTPIWLVGYRHLDTEHEGRKLPRPFAWIYALRVSTDFDKYEAEKRKWERR